MLLDLEIQNVALIEKLSIEFSPGLNILTGETGAGKSIVIDSIGLALGGRADRGLIRTGEDRMRVQAVFDVSKNAAARAYLAENGLEDEDGTVSVVREVAASGRNLTRIAGQLMPLASLRAFTALIVDVHGQHEHQSLLNEATHLRCLDAWAGAGVEALRQDTAAAYAAARAAKKRLDDFASDPAELARRMDMLSFQISEITAAALEPGEEERIAERLVRLKNAGRIAAAIAQAHAVLSGGAPGRIREAAEALSSVAAYEPRCAGLADRLSECYYTLEDTGYELGSVADEIGSYDEREVDALEDRREAIGALKRKYGADIPAILAHRDRAQVQLDALASGEDTMRRLRAEYERCHAALDDACAALSRARRAAAAEFCAAVMRHLADLSMPAARFEAVFSPAAPGADGADEVRFHISPNAGEPLKPLIRIASGGELSRIMLALKTITAERDCISTMIFDEIDTGISGRVAGAVAAKMRAIAGARQVICVSHLAPIAVAGDRHFLIEKRELDGRTSTSLRPIAGEERVREVARLTGAGETAAAMAAAREMLRRAESL